ncbi:MAG TPA: tetratricopeptide repeat protein, partial [Chitinophagales bacterium]|nr:tetratricopeptide repeat protein [Chitinophagales bacterium]
VATGCLVCCALWGQAQLSTQPEKKDTRDGNKQFEKDNYTDAEASYKKALTKKKDMPEAVFNLGDAVYEQKRYDEAIKQFEQSAKTNPDPLVKAKAYHNLGNVYLEQRKWQDAANAYINALKLNPNDRDTKYNLAYANAMLVQQKNQNQQKNDKDKKDNKDQKQQNKDQQNKDNNKNDQKPDQPKNGDQGQDKKEGQKQAGAQPKLTKEEAEKLLKALNDEEQKTNNKVQQKQARPANVKIEKDW